MTTIMTMPITTTPTGKSAPAMIMATAMTMTMNTAKSVPAVSYTHLLHLGAKQPEGPHCAWQRTTLLVLAVTRCV